MPLTHPSRRAVLSGALAGGALAALQAIPAQAKAPDSRSSVAQAVAFLDTMSNAYPASGTPTLPQSYADELGLFSTSFVYDAAVTVCAALAAGRTGLARRVGDGLLFAQAHDPDYHDGRLRQAYNVGAVHVLRRQPQPVRARAAGRYGEHRLAVRLSRHGGRRHGVAGHRFRASVRRHP